MATKYIHPYDSQQVETFLKHYRSQIGSGGIPVFRGERFQSGAGLGNILSSIGRFLLPIVTPAAQRFIGETYRGYRAGKTIKEAAKEAFKPALSTAIGTTSKQIRRRIMGKNQKGGRRRRRRQGGQLAKTHKKRAKSRKRVYKGMVGGGRKRKATRKKTKSSHRRTKRVRYLNPSFANF